MEAPPLAPPRLSAASLPVTLSQGTTARRDISAPVKSSQTTHIISYFALSFAVTSPRSTGCKSGARLSPCRGTSNPLNHPTSGRHLSQRMQRLSKSEVSKKLKLCQMCSFPRPTCANFARPARRLTKCMTLTQRPTPVLKGTANSNMEFRQCCPSSRVLSTVFVHQNCSMDTDEGALSRCRANSVRLRSCDSQANCKPGESCAFSGRQAHRATHVLFDRASMSTQLQLQRSHRRPRRYEAHVSFDRLDPATCHAWQYATARSRLPTAFS